MNEFLENKRERLQQIQAQLQHIRQRNQQLQQIIKRYELLKTIQFYFENDFLKVDAYYQQHAQNEISVALFKQQKYQFVKNWFEQYALKNNHYKFFIPDAEQIAAIATTHGHQQIIARAGSGKTAVLVNRSLFLIKHCHVPASQILLLAFNRKAVLELRKRLLELFAMTDNPIFQQYQQLLANRFHKKIHHNHENKQNQLIIDIASELNIELPYIMTFHALAYAIVHPENPPLFDDDTEDNSQKLSKVVQKIIDDYLAIEPFNIKIKQFMMLYFLNDWHKIEQGGYDQKHQLEIFLQFQRQLPRQSLKGDVIKSFGEKIIANFLFEHNINYQYEHNHFWNKINYRPDFTLFHSDNRGVIIEYFGLQGDLDYDFMSQQKRDYWSKKPNWHLLAYSPTDISERGVDYFLQRLKQDLQQQGFICQRLSEEEIWHKISRRSIDQFTKLIVSFITRCRKKSLSIKELQQMIETYQATKSIEVLFFELILNFYHAYLERITATNEDDFNGLLQKAIELILHKQTVFQSKSYSSDLTLLRYICIDEFQDFSELFYRLLQAIRQHNSQVNLCCVGDSWQAINGFAGSELRFFQRFKYYIDKNATQLYISSNYRSASSIVTIGNQLMIGNGRAAIAKTHFGGEAMIADLDHFVLTEHEKQIHVHQRHAALMVRLIAKALIEELEVVILCRRNKLPFANHLVHFLHSIQKFFPDSLHHRITISTAHKYKGLEKAVVIIPDAIIDYYPLIHPNWFFFQILGDNLKQIYDEERRLFYVSLTRAIKRIIIITENHRQSPFLQALEIKPIDWAEYPPLSDYPTLMQTEFIYYLIKITNQSNRGFNPTCQIKHLLKSCGYHWESIQKHWVKSVLRSYFEIDKLKMELWCQKADGIEVYITDNHHQTIEHFMINDGCWSQISIQ